MALDFLSTPKAQALALFFVVVVLFKTTQSVLQSRRRRQFARQHGCQPVTAQYRHKFPYLGMDRIKLGRQARKEYRVISWAHQNFRDAGQYTLSFRLFTQKVILTSEPANIKAIFATNFNDFDTAGRLDFIGQVVGKGIFTADGEEWKHSRAMIRPNFARAQVANIDAIEVFLQDMFKLLPKDGATVDLQPLFFGLTMDTSTEFLFGESVHSLRGDEPGKPSGVAFAHAYDTALLESVHRATQSPLARIMGQSKEDLQNCKIVHDFVQRYIDEALRWRRTWDGGEKTAPPTGQYTFLFELVKETTDPEVLRGEVLNLLLAGRDTTASLLGSMFFQLAKRPDIWARLRSEVAELHGAKPSFEELKNMKLLQWCMKESMLSLTNPPIPHLPLFQSSPPNILHESILRISTSPPHKHNRPRRPPQRKQRHDASPRRRARRAIAHPRVKGPDGLLPDGGHAPPRGHLGSRRRGVESRSLGDGEAGCLGTYFYFSCCVVLT